MARIRSTYPDQWTDASFCRLSPWARLLALALRNDADDYGVFEWDPLQIKIRCLPADNVDVDDLLEELLNAGGDEDRSLIRRVTVDGRNYGLIRNFCRFQRPQKPKHKYPIRPQDREYLGLERGSEPDVPDSSDTGTVPVPDQSDTGTYRKGREGKGGDSPPTPPPSGGEVPAPPDAPRPPRARRRDGPAAPGPREVLAWPQFEALARHAVFAAAWADWADWAAKPETKAAVPRGAVAEKQLVRALACGDPAKAAEAIRHSIAQDYASWNVDWAPSLRLVAGRPNNATQTMAEQYLLEERAKAEAEEFDAASCADVRGLVAGGAL